MLLLSPNDKKQFIQDYQSMPIREMCRKYNAGEVSIHETGRKLTGERKPRITPHEYNVK